MNQIIGRSVRTAPHILVLTAFAAAFAMAGSAGAFASTVEQPAVDGAHARHVSAKKKSVEETAEDRINYLHKVLQITPAQEDQWNKVAVVIRGNADQITILAKARSENAKSMTAVDDLKSYADFASAHEDGTRKLIPVFQSLYENMSEPQQKVADMVFRDHGRSGHMGSKS
jgi:protein CpxP